MEKAKKGFPLNKTQIALICFVVVYIAIVLVNILAIKTPFVAVIVFAVLEAVLATLLKKTPIYIHAGVLIAQIIAGIIAGHVVFVILSCVVYVAALVALSFMQSEDK